MISQTEDLYVGKGDTVTVVLPTTTHQTLESFVAVTQLVEAVGKLAVESGLGQPLAAFQRLMKTYQMLAKAEAALRAAAHFLLSAAKPPPLGA